MGNTLHHLHNGERYKDIVQRGGADMSEAPDGMYLVRDGVTYRIEPRLAEMFIPAKKYNLVTGEVTYSTNADRIRAMSDEELAQFLSDCADHPRLEWWQAWVKKSDWEWSE